MKVLVAGATGAIGRRLVPMLVNEGHDVVAMTRNKDKLPLLRSWGATGEIADACDPGQVTSLMRRTRPDAIIHELTDLPASLKPNKLKAAYAANNHVRKVGTQNLLAAAKETDVQRIVAQSCAFWYRPGGIPIKDETQPLDTEAGDPIGEAVRTMAAVEKSLLSAGTPEAAILRYGVFYGPGTWYHPDGDVGQQIRKNRYPIIGTGAGVTSFVHIDDAALATVLALTGPPGVYNIVDDHPAPVNEWLPAMADAFGAKKPRRAPAWLAKMMAGKAAVNWLENQRGATNALAKSRLGWEPRYPDWRTGFRKGMRQSLSAA